MRRPFAMAPSGPYGFDRPDITSTSSGTPLPLLSCNIGAGPPAKLARRLLRKMPEAQAMGMGRRAGQGAPDASFRPCAGVQVGGKGHMAKATLTNSSENYSSWSLRGWLPTKFSGLEFD